MMELAQAGDWTRPCRDCGKRPDATTFGISQRRGQFVYRKSYCCICSRSRWAAANRRRWDKADADERRMKIRHGNVRKTYGISAAEYQLRFQLQGGRCAICSCEISLGRKGPGRPAHLDHDHATGRLRSFLCDRCNGVIGMAQDRCEVLRAAIQYLEKGQS